MIDHDDRHALRRRRTKEVVGGSTNYVIRLHALDSPPAPRSSAARSSSGRASQAPAPAPSGGVLPFLPLRENQRTALLLLNGVVYFAFSSHGDVQPYHGWIFGYNASTLQRTLARLPVAEH